MNTGIEFAENAVKRAYSEDLQNRYCHELKYSTDRI